MSASVQIIVLHTIKHKDNDVIVQGYSNRGGRESFYIRGAKSSKKRANLVHLHPLSIIDAEISSFSLGDIPSIKEFSPAFRLSSLRVDIKKNTIALFISELLYRTIREIEKNDLLYNYILESVLWLENTTEGVSNFHLWFIVNLCKHLGYSPKPDRAFSSPVFDVVSATFTDKHSISLTGTNTGIYLDEPESRLLYTLSTISPEELNTIKTSGITRYRFVKDMINYLRLHSGADFRVESLDVLHEVFE